MIVAALDIKMGQNLAIIPSTCTVNYLPPSLHWKELILTNNKDYADLYSLPRELISLLH